MKIPNQQDSSFIDKNDVPMNELRYKQLKFCKPSLPCILGPIHKQKREKVPCWIAETIAHVRSMFKEKQFQQNLLNEHMLLLVQKICSKEKIKNAKVEIK